MTYKSMAVGLSDTGLCVCPGFISSSLLEDSAKNLDQLRADGEFHAAAIGRGHTSRPDLKIRNNEIFWLDRQSENQIQRRLWRKIESLRTALNQSLYLGLSDSEVHYAAYPAGGFYGRHLDCFQGGSERVISFVLYLNRGWQAEDGGCLRVYSGGGAAGTLPYTDIEPIGGTLVCFMSAESEHEVLMNHRPRFSLTGWFLRKGSLS